MNEEEEFGLAKTTRDADPMEREVASAVQDHPDFTFVSADEICAALQSGDKRAVPGWMTNLPVEKDASKWRILEVQIRPDRSWEVIKELLATVCIGKGLVLTEERPASVLFRKKVTQESVANGIVADSATFQNVFVRIGVSPAKLRVVDICTLVADENKLLGGMMSTSRPAPWTAQEAIRASNYALDQLLGAVQATLLSQHLSLSHLYMSTSENSVDAVESAELDEGYITDLQKAFSSEMKINMRDLCIPLEEYAYDQEFACALLIGLLEPTLKKYGIRLTKSTTTRNGSSTTEDAASTLTEDLTTLSVAEAPELSEEKAPVPVPPPSVPEPASVSSSPTKTQTSEEKGDKKTYGETVTELVQQLWRVCKEDCEAKVRAKIEEKQQQVTARVEAVQDLRTRAILSIMSADGAEVSSLKASTPADTTNVLLYEASCMVNSMPVTFHVTYGALIYRTMVPMFATTTVVPFDDVVSVTQTTSFGIQVLAVELEASKYAKGLTIAMGLEVDLLYQLLLEIVAMHKREAKESVKSVPPLQQQEVEKNPEELKKILGSEEEEEKEAQADDLQEGKSPVAGAAVSVAVAAEAPSLKNENA